MHQKILVTGAAGFVGSHALRTFANEAECLYAVVRPGKNLKAIEDLMSSRLGSKVQIVECDLDQHDELKIKIQSLRPDCCLHFAWPSGSHTQDPSMNQQALKNSMRLAEFLVDSGCKLFVGAGSSSEYAREDGALSPYAQAKISLLDCLEKRAAKHGFEFLWPRFFHLHGPFESPRRLLPYLCTSALKAEDVVLRNGRSEFDYIYVGSALEALKEALRARLRGVFDVGSGHCISVQDIAKTVYSYANLNTDKISDLAEKEEFSLHAVQADLSRLQRECSWQPRESPQEGFLKTWNWWKSKSKARKT